MNSERAIILVEKAWEGGGRVLAYERRKNTNFSKKTQLNSMSAAFPEPSASNLRLKQVKDERAVYGTDQKR